MKRQTESTRHFLVRVIKFVVIVQVVDSLFFLGDAGWFAANLWLVVLTGLGIVGAAIAWTTRRETAIAGGALLVVLAPSIFYPLAIVLALLAVGLIGMVVGQRTKNLARLGASPRRALDYSNGRA